MLMNAYAVNGRPQVYAGALQALFLHVLSKLGKICIDAGVLATPHKKSRQEAAAVTGTIAVAPAATANADMIKAEHMPSSAMPAMDSVKLGTKSSLLPSAAAEATQLAASAAAGLPRSQTATASKLTGQASSAEVGVDAQSKRGTPA